MAVELLAAAINGIYQGVLVTVLVALSLRGLRRANAATRHAVWLCTLVLLVFLVVAHCFVDSRPDIARMAAPQLEIDPPNRAAVPVITQGAQTEFGSPAPSLSEDSPAEDVQIPGQKVDLLLWTSQELSDAEQRFPAVGNLPVLPALSEPRTHPSIVDVRLATSEIDNRSAWLHTWTRRLANPVSLTFAFGSRGARIGSVIVLGVCLTLAGARLFVLLLRLFQIRKLKRHSLPPSAACNELFQDLVTRLRIGRRVELRTSPTSQTSFLLGFFHPVVLLPNEDRMGPGDAEPILRHELAHVRRRDDWANLVQHFILAALPFHPAAWWISRQLSLQREIACDDHVLQSSAQPRAYALLLANLAARMQRPPPLLAPGASHNKTQLQQRIDMILNRHRNASPRLGTTCLTLITSAATLVAITVICAAPRIVLAQTDPAPPAVSAPPDGAATVGIAAVNFAPDADPVESPSTPRPAGIGPGPKFKPGAPVPAAPPAASPNLPTPVVPAAPVALTPPAAQPVPYNPFLAGADNLPNPRPGRLQHATRNREADASLEERLERLERLVESLMAREGQDPLHWKQSFEKYGALDRKDIARSEARAKQMDVARKHRQEEIEKIKEQAHQDAASEAGHVKRSVDAEKAARTEQKRRTKDLKESSRKQLEVLRQRLEMLEREREKLDRQIEELEQNQEQLDEDQANDAPSDESEARPDPTQADRQ